MHTRKRSICSVTLFMSLFAVVTPVERSATAQETSELLNLRGIWKFELGDNPDRAAADFDDSKWTEINVPLKWEEQGFPGYDGYAWYRRTFYVPSEWRGRTLLLKLGYVDDVDEVYINGRFVAFDGSFPPHFITAYGTAREYPLPTWCLEYGKENVIAVRVYDEVMEGGITRGQVGVYQVNNAIAVDQNLSGLWRFATGDSLQWSLPATNDGAWKRVQVPAYWETQGYCGYDGMGWYRTTIRLKGDLENEHLVLMLGKIDDIDEVYLNGEKIGGIGSFTPKGLRSIRHDEYRRWRAYTIPPELLVEKGDNVLAVRVYDNFLHGGIYAGPVGIVTRTKYLQWQKGEKGYKGKGIDFWVKFQEIIQDLLH
jgi:hypothetical protein